jgi:hypothetical protein
MGGVGCLYSIRASTKPSDIAWRRRQPADPGRTSLRLREGCMSNALLPPYSVTSSTVSVGSTSAYRLIELANVALASSTSTRPSWTQRQLADDRIFRNRRPGRREA